jgi:hypothetical protein
MVSIREEILGRITDVKRVAYAPRADIRRYMYAAKQPFVR